MTLEIDGPEYAEHVVLVRAEDFDALKFLVDHVGRSEPPATQILSKLNTSIVPAFEIGRGRFILIRNEDRLVSSLTDAAVSLVLVHDRSVTTAWLHELFKEQLKVSISLREIFEAADSVYKTKFPSGHGKANHMQEFITRVVSESPIRRVSLFSKLWIW